MIESRLKIGIICLLLVFLSIGAVSASDEFNETINSTDDADEIIAEETSHALESTSEKSESVNDTSADTPIHPDIKVNTVEGNEGQALTLKATVKSDNGTAVPATVKFKFNGQTYTAPTDSDGVASVTLKFPKSTVLKSTSKTKGKILTKTTYYQKAYDCDVTVEGSGLVSGTSAFKVISKKTPTVVKYKIIKKKKTYTLKLKKGTKIGKGLIAFKTGKYATFVYKYNKGRYTHYATGVMDKDENLHKFYIKEHYKENGKWKWNKWLKVPKDNLNYFSFYKGSLKLDKIKVKFTQVSYKKI